MLVDLTYMYAPNDDANKDRVLFHLVGSDSDSDSEDESDIMRKITDITENLRNSEDNEDNEDRTGKIERFCKATSGPHSPSDLG